MKKIIISLIALSLMFVPSASAESPSKEVIVASNATYTGTLKQKDGGGDWACTATIKGDGFVHVKWAHSEVDYKGKMGPAGGKVGNPIVMNGTGPDNSEVRFVWNSLDELEVQWWPNKAAKAGQQQNKPPHVSGKIPKK